MQAWLTLYSSFKSQATKPRWRHTAWRRCDRRAAPAGLCFLFSVAAIAWRVLHSWPDGMMLGHMWLYLVMLEVVFPFRSCLLSCVPQIHAFLIYVVLTASQYDVVMYCRGCVFLVLSRGVLCCLCFILRFLSHIWIKYFLGLAIIFSLEIIFDPMLR